MSEMFVGVAIFTSESFDILIRHCLTPSRLQPGVGYSQ